MHISRHCSCRSYGTVVRLNAVGPKGRCRVAGGVTGMNDGHVPLLTQGRLEQTAAAWYPTQKTHVSLRHMRAVGLGMENPDRGDWSVSEGTSVYHALTSTDSRDTVKVAVQSSSIRRLSVSSLLKVAPQNFMVGDRAVRSYVSCQIARQADTLCVLCVAAVETPARERRFHFFGVSEYISGHMSKCTASRSVQTIVFVLNSSDSPSEGGLASA